MASDTMTSADSHGSEAVDLCEDRFRITRGDVATLDGFEV